jgi:hypothetical protein
MFLDAWLADARLRRGPRLGDQAGGLGAGLPSVTRPDH